MKNFINSEFAIGLIILIVIAVLIKIVSKEKIKWHDMEVIPGQSQFNHRISDDIIIRDLTTEKEFRAYYDYSREHYVDYKGNMVWGGFVWRWE